MKKPARVFKAQKKYNMKWKKKQGELKDENKNRSKRRMGFMKKERLDWNIRLVWEILNTKWKKLKCENLHYNLQLIN